MIIVPPLRRGIVSVWRRVSYGTLNFLFIRFPPPFLPLSPRFRLPPSYKRNERTLSSLTFERGLAICQISLRTIFQRYCCSFPFYRSFSFFFFFFFRRTKVASTSRSLATRCFLVFVFCDVDLCSSSVLEYFLQMIKTCPAVTNF